MIRPARYEDWEGVRDLWREVDNLHAALAPDYFRAAERGLEEWRRLLAAPEAAVLVATPAAAVTGAVSVRIYDTPAEATMVPRRRGHVEMLVVSRAHRRRGMGRALMSEAAAWARSRGAAELVLTVWAGNQEAEAFYRSLGYGVLSQVLHAPLGGGARRRR